MNPSEPPKKKETVRISKKDLLALLSENEHLQQQVKDLQGRCNEYLEEVRSLKKDLEEAEAALLEGDKKESLADQIKKAMEDIEPPPSESFSPSPHHYNPHVYIDGASKFRR